MTVVLLALTSKEDFLEKATNTERAKIQKQINIREAELHDKSEEVENLVELVKAKSKVGIKETIKIEAEIALLEQELELLSSKLDMVSSPTRFSSIDRIKAFHQRFILEEADKSEKDQFYFSLQNIMEKIVIHSPEDGYRTKAVIYLLSGVKLVLKVDKDYSTNVYRDGERIGRYNAPPRTCKRRTKQ